MERMAPMGRGFGLVRHLSGIRMAIGAGRVPHKTEEKNTLIHGQESHQVTARQINTEQEPIRHCPKGATNAM